MTNITQVSCMKQESQPEQRIGLRTRRLPERRNFRSYLHHPSTSSYEFLEHKRPDSLWQATHWESMDTEYAAPEKDRDGTGESGRELAGSVEKLVPSGGGKEKPFQEFRTRESRDPRREEETSFTDGLTMMASKTQGIHTCAHRCSHVCMHTCKYVHTCMHIFIGNRLSDKLLSKSGFSLLLWEEKADRFGAPSWETPN